MKRMSSLRVLALALLLAPAAPLPATVLQELGFEELVEASQLIFIGSVLQHEVEAADGLVYTHVQFRLEELVSGTDPGPEFSLRFVGGTAAGSAVEVSGQYLPPVGLRALWFVRAPLVAQVNPLTGWQQGVFPLQAGPDGELLLDLSSRPELLLRGAGGDPLVQKMLQAGFDERRIAARVSNYQRFPLSDFLDAVRSHAGVQP